MHRVLRSLHSTTLKMVHRARVTCNSKEEFDAALAAHAGKDTPLLVLFTGSSDSTGKSWCPDCNDAKPVIEQAIDKADGPLAVITVPLVRAEYSGNAAHWARVHPAVKLQRIPTLYRWAANGKRPEDALVEEDAKVPSKVGALIAGE